MSAGVQLWRLCLEMVALAEFSDAAYVRQLWDVHLKAVWESAAAAEAGEGASEESAAAAALEAACVEVEQLGEQYFPDEIRWALPRGRCLAAELCLGVLLSLTTAVHLTVCCNYGDHPLLMPQVDS